MVTERTLGKALGSLLRWDSGYLVDMVEPCICHAYFQGIIRNCNRRVRQVGFERVGEYCSRGGDEEDAVVSLAGVEILGCAPALLARWSGIDGATPSSSCNLCSHGRVGAYPGMKTCNPMGGCI
jgi:hypothetical protein